MKKYLALLSLTLMTGLALCDKQPLVKTDETPVSQPTSQATLNEQKTKELEAKIQEILKNNTSLMQQCRSRNNAKVASNETQKQINMSLKGINFSLSVATLYYMGQSLRQLLQVAPGQPLPIPAQIAMMLSGIVAYCSGVDVVFSGTERILKFFDWLTEPTIITHKTAGGKINQIQYI